MMSFPEIGIKSPVLDMLGLRDIVDTQVGS